MADQNAAPPSAMPPTTPAVQPQTGQYQQMPQGFPPANYQPPQYTQTFPHFTHSAQQAEQLSAFWKQQMVEVEQVGNDPAEFKNHQLPLARIKKIMKSDEDVRMISAEAPVLFAKACEMFILELTLRSWIHAEENKRRTLQRNDIAAAITKTDIFDFLVDIVPREEVRPDNPEQRPPAPPHAMPGAPGMFYPYPGMPGVPTDPNMLARPPPMPMDPTAMMYQQQFMSLQNPQWPQQAMAPTMPQAPPPQQPTADTISQP